MKCSHIFWEGLAKTIRWSRSSDMGLGMGGGGMGEREQEGMVRVGSSSERGWGLSLADWWDPDILYWWDGDREDEICV